MGLDIDRSNFIETVSFNIFEAYYIIWPNNKLIRFLEFLFILSSFENVQLLVLQLTLKCLSRAWKELSFISMYFLQRAPINRSLCSSPKLSVNFLANTSNSTSCSSSAARWIASKAERNLKI